MPGIIGVEHLESVFRGAASHSGDNQISAYIGLEPSGKAHLGWIIWEIHQEFVR